MKSWKDCRNLLVIRLDNMGDVIMNHGALLELKRHSPQCKLTLLTSTAAAPIAPYLEGIDDCLIFDTPWVKLEDTTQQADTFQLINTLRDRQFDGCVIFTVYSQSSLPAALLAYLAGIPLRAAYARENPYHLLTHWLPDTEPLQEIKHQIHRDLALLNVFGILPDFRRIPCLRHIDEERVSGSAAIQDVGLDSSYIIVNVDVSERKRRFNTSTTNSLIRQLLEHEERVVFTGQRMSSYLTSCIHDIANPRFIDLVGRTNLEELLFLTNHARGVISVNTGTMHIACAYNRPVLALYANTNPQHIPWSQHSDYILFDIPAALKSKNQIVRYVSENISQKDNPIPTPKEILQRFYGVLEMSSRSQVSKLPQPV